METKIEIKLDLSEIKQAIDQWLIRRGYMADVKPDKQDDPFTWRHDTANHAIRGVIVNCVPYQPPPQDNGEK